MGSHCGATTDRAKIYRNSRSEGAPHLKVDLEHFTMYSMVNWQHRYFLVIMMAIGTTKSSRLIIAFFIFCFGILLGVLPAALAEIGIKQIGSASQFLFWMAFLCCIIGAAVAVSHLIKIEAVGEVTVPLFGRNLPLEIQGATFILIIFLLGAGSIVFGTKLHKQYDYYEIYERQKSNFASERSKLKHAEETVKILQNILTGKHVQKLHLLKLAVACGGSEQESLTTWNMLIKENKKLVLKSFDTNQTPLPVGLKQRIYQIPNTNSLQITVNFDENGAISGRITIRDAAQLRQICGSLLEKLNSAWRSFGGDDEKEASKANR